MRIKILFIFFASPCTLNIPTISWSLRYCRNGIRWRVHFWTTLCNFPFSPPTLTCIDSGILITLLSRLSLRSKDQVAHPVLLHVTLYKSGSEAYFRRNHCSRTLCLSLDKCIFTGVRRAVRVSKRSHMKETWRRSFRINIFLKF